MFFRLSFREITISQARLRYTVRTSHSQCSVVHDAERFFPFSHRFYFFPKKHIFLSVYAYTVVQRERVASCIFRFEILAF